MARSYSPRSRAIRARLLRQPPPFGVVRRLVVGQRLGVELRRFPGRPDGSPPCRGRGRRRSPGRPGHEVNASSSSAVERSRSRWAWANVPEPVRARARTEGAIGWSVAAAMASSRSHQPRPRSDGPAQPEADQGAGQPQRLFDLPLSRKPAQRRPQVAWSASSRSSQRPCSAPFRRGASVSARVRKWRAWAARTAPPRRGRRAARSRTPGSSPAGQSAVPRPRRVAADQVVVDQSRDRVED